MDEWKILWVDLELWIKSLAPFFWGYVVRPVVGSVMCNKAAAL